MTCAVKGVVISHCLNAVKDSDAAIRHTGDMASPLAFSRSFNRAASPISQTVPLLRSLSLGHVADHTLLTRLNSSPHLPLLLPSFLSRETLPSASACSKPYFTSFQSFSQTLFSPPSSFFRKKPSKLKRNSSTSLNTLGTRYGISFTSRG